MSTTLGDAEFLLPLTPAVFHILLALSGGEMHGYGIMQEVEKFTEGKMRMGPGTLYGTVKRLIVAHLIEECRGRPVSTEDDERRRYYRLTAFGQRVTAAEAKRLAALVRLAKRRGLEVAAT